jgi:two-component system chemotaxis response regulator CheY
MITAETRPENILAAKSAGADNYIIKPFTAETLRGKLETVSAD